jgi:hypothetical protein
MPATFLADLAELITQHTGVNVSQLVLDSVRAFELDVCVVYILFYFILAI